MTGQTMEKRRAVHPLRHLIAGLVAWLACTTTLAAPLPALYSYAIVRNDVTIEISNRTIHLYGIYVPTDECDYLSTLPRCTHPAVLALRFKIQGFVHCQPVWRNRDGSLTAMCRVGRTQFRRGEDLSAYLISKGWALATQYAPVQYRALERIARAEGQGVWAGNSYDY